MRRRIIGLLVLLVALLGFAVTTRLNHPVTVAGAAGLEPGEPMATVDECLLTPPPTTYAFRPGEALSPQAKLGSCAEAHYGEVIAVVQGDLNEQSVNTCHSADPLGYLGIPVATPNNWAAVPAFAMALAGPDARQYAAGQHWFACVVSVAPGEAAITTPLRDAYSTGTPPASFASCLSAADPYFASSVSCSTPHRSELFAFAGLAGPLGGIDDLDAKCRQLIDDATGIPDLAADGLEVRVTAYLDQGPQYTPADFPLPAGVTAGASCEVTSAAGRQLNASLADLGSAAVPWLG